MKSIGNRMRRHATAAVVAVIAVVGLGDGAVGAQPVVAHAVQPAHRNPHFDANATWVETTGGAAHTWTNYTNAGGTQGPTIAAYQQVQIACALPGFRVADSNTWWYLIASAPWSRQYYVSADPFYNNGATSGSLHGTPFVDSAIQICGTGGGGTGVAETSGGSVHTWTNYSNAGGSQGQSVGANTTVTIACRVQGFAVADGNSWWYQIASSPWNNTFYGSADAFYNNGATSGSLHGTPFVDYAVPVCGSAQSSGVTATAQPSTVTEWTGPGGSGTFSDFTNAGGNVGTRLSANTAYQVVCKVQGFAVADGNTWWYEIGSSPWNGAFFSSADTFYNNGATSGSLHGTPYVDSNVPPCVFGTNTVSSAGGYSPSVRGNVETAGSAGSGSFLDYQDEGGQGVRVGGYQSVSVSCVATGYAVGKDHWWYLVADSPWNDQYWVPADNFYNNGQTSGDIHNTPWVDSQVPQCQPNQLTVAPIYGDGSSSPVPSCHRADPVNCATGNFYEDFTDVKVGEFGPQLLLQRSYNDQLSAVKGSFGNGWTSTLDVQLAVSARDGSITITLPGGTTVLAVPNGSGGFSLPLNPGDSLVATPTGYSYVQNQTLTYAFDSSGALQSITDLDGRSEWFTYDGSGHVVTVTDAAGQVMTVAWNAAGLVSSVSDPMGRTTTYSYDAQGNLTSTVDPLGRTWTFAYDATSRMTSATDPAGGTTTNTYDSSGRVVKQVDPAGLATTFAYTGDNFSSTGGTTTITDPYGMVEVEQYANGLLFEDQKAAGTSIQSTKINAYSQTGLLLCSASPDTVAAAPAGGPTPCSTPTVWSPGETVNTYDASGNLTSTTDPTGATSTMTYNSFGEVLTSTDARGKTKTLQYDIHGNLTSTTDAMGVATQLTYGDGAHQGLPTSITSPSGTMDLGYDSAGDVTSTVEHPDGNTTITAQSSFNADDEVICTVTRDAYAQGVRCGPQQTWQLGITWTTYDAAGQIVLQKGPTGGITRKTFDAMGRQTSVVNPDGSTTTTSYDADGRPLVVTDGAGGASPQATTYAYDLTPGSGACPTGATIASCTTATNGLGGITLSVFNLLGRIVASTQPGGIVTKYAFDPSGNRVAARDALGRTTTWSYDADNRVTSIVYSDGLTPNVTFAYDANGNRTSMVDGTGTTTSTYDADNRLIEVVNGDGQTVRYTYTSAGKVSSITYPNGSVVSYTYDGASRLTGLTDLSGESDQFSYDPSGNVIATTLSNGDRIVATFDQSNELLTKSLLSSTGACLAAIAIRRLPSGLIARETDTGALKQDIVYVYDRRGDLLAAGAPSVVAKATSEFAFDAAGNLTKNQGTTQTYTPGAELQSATTGNATTQFTYDGVGDLTQAAPSGTLATTYTFDQAARLTKVTQPFAPPTISAIAPSSGPSGGGTTVTITGSGFTNNSTVNFGTRLASSVFFYSSTELIVVSPALSVGTYGLTVTSPYGSATASTKFTVFAGSSTTHRLHRSRPRTTAVNTLATFTYNGDGLRMTETVGQQTSQFAWNTLGQVPMILTDGTENYVYGPNGTVVEQVSGNSTSPQWFFQDGVQSTRALTDSTGAVTGTYSYSVYGAPTQTGSATTPLEFAGGYWDAATSLEYLVNRYYLPRFGVFLTVDPALLMTDQPYQYANADPVNSIDPIGLWSLGDDFDIAYDIASLGEDFLSGGALLAAHVTLLLINAVQIGYTCSGHWTSVGCALAIASGVVSAFGLKVPGGSDADRILTGVGLWLTSLSIVHDWFKGSTDHGSGGSTQTPQPSSPSSTRPSGSEPSNSPC